VRIAFLGTPDFAVPCLTALGPAGHDVVLVVTQPDRPKGRGRHLEPTPVKAAALERGYPVFQPEKPNRPENVAVVAETRPDLLVVVAYGAILKSALLSLAPKGAVNVHASLLPRHRGMSPIQRAVWDGDAETGVTTMYMDEGVDTGDMILTERTPIGPDETAGELHDRLALLGARLLVDTLARIDAGTAPRVPQPAEGVTYAGRLTKADGLLDWRLPAARLHAQARAVTPWPGATALLAGEPLLVVRCRPAEPEPEAESASAKGTAPATPGTLLGIAGDALRVATGQGALDLVQVRPAGRATMTGAEFARGRRLAAGQAFDLPGGAATEAPR
jgi:methionyl-tRNA formyltransferase